MAEDTQRQGPTRNEVRTRLATLLHEIVGVPAEQITDTATIDEQLQMQSVAFVELQVAIEETYNIQLDPIRVVELNAFGAIVDYVRECAAQSAT